MSGMFSSRLDAKREHTYANSVMTSARFLGCGAHMQELRRTRVGPFVEDESLVTLHDISYLFSLWQETKDEALLRKFVSPMEKSFGVAS